jgi:hypothetical protein
VPLVKTTLQEFVTTRSMNERSAFHIQTIIFQ